MIWKENDELYSFGVNKDGQLGIGNNENQLTPQKIEFFKNMKIKQISCGTYHSLILTGTYWKQLFLNIFSI